MPDAGAHGATTDTIFAPATGEGRGAVAIVRISGSRAHDALQALTGRPTPAWRMLSLRTLRDRAGEVLDQAMVVAFPEGASYTGEAMAEVHCHGGPAVVSDLLDLLAGMPGLRLAEPGEFTRRALMAGQMDLTEVEGLRDLITAETSAQRRQALRIQSGAVSRRVAEWRSLLLRARALVEVTLDWADEEVPEDTAPEVSALLTEVLAGMEHELSRSGPAERLRSGFEVAIIGAPNAGKSSLLNAIAGREAAIVSDVPGTTRDVVEVRCDLKGLPVTFLDTAGLRDASDAVEAIGVDRARRRARSADLRLLVRAPDAAAEPAAEMQKGDILIWAKSDLARGAGDVVVSALRDEGIDDLLELVRGKLAGVAREAGIIATLRQRGAVEDARRHLLEGHQASAAGEPELAAEALRLATEALDRLVGRIGVDDVLAEVFAGFCLGK